MFDIMQARQLKVNPTKSFFGVSTGKFLGFIVTSKEIYLDPDKINAIQSMQPLKTLTRQTCLYPKIHHKSVGSMSTFHKVNEEGRLHLG